MNLTAPMKLISSSIALAIVLIASPLSAIEPETERPNILWLIGEDLGPELACYGTPGVKTPNLDRLAKRGMRFTRGFTTAPVCSASRSALITGMYQTTIGAHNHRSHRGDGYTLPDGVKILPHRLRDAGYFTANVVHLTDGPEAKFYRGTGKTDWNFNLERNRKPFESNRWDDLKANQPFYAQVNFPETHRGGSWNNAHKHIPHPANPETVAVPSYYPDHPLVRRDWAQYLNAVMALDKKIGFVLDQLEADGLADNTIVIFMGDHGRAMIRGKQWCYDSGLHIPLLIFIPETYRTEQTGYAAGTVSERIVEHIDLTATTLDWAGVEKPESMQGRILFGERAEPLRKAAFAARDRCDETVFRIRTVRTPRYRYIRNFLNERPFLQLNRYKEASYPVLPLMRKLHAEGKLDGPPAVLMAPSRPTEELYDLENDPYEVKNLAESPDHQEILQKLRGEVTAWIERTDDQGVTLEDPAIVEEWDRRMKANYERKQRKKQ